MVAAALSRIGEHGTSSPWNETGTASIIAVRNLVKYSRVRGVDIDRLLDAIGVPHSGLDDPDRRIPEKSRARLWTAAEAGANDPFFGLHVAEQARMGTLDALDYALYFSATLGNALDQLSRFHRVLCDAWGFKLELDDTSARLRRVERTPPPEAEAFFAFIVLRSRELTGADLAPQEVRFAHAAPADVTHHLELFRCPVHFGCSATELVLRREHLALSIKTALPGIESVLERYMSEVLGRLPKSESFVERVRTVVAGALRDGPPRIGKVADELHASPRTLQRKLGEHGTRYSEVVDSVRRELGERLVAEGRLSITEIAFLLGFNDVGGFRSVYRRWTGSTPSRGRSRVIAASD